MPGTNPSAKKVVIFGASGRTGRHVVQEALRQGWEVTAFVREPAQVPLQHERLRFIQGDANDPAAVERALAGQDAVLCALGHVKGSPKDLLGVVGRNVVAAMRKHGIRRLVTLLGALVTVPGDEPPTFGQKLFSGVMKRMAADLFQDTDAHAAVVLDSGLDWVIVRPLLLTDKPKQGRVQAAPYQRLGMGSSITRADLADFMVRQVTSDEYLRKAPMVRG